MLSRARLDSYAEKAGALERAAVAAAYDEIAAWVASNPDAPFAVAAAEVASIIERASELPMSAAASLARALFSLIAAEAGEGAPEGPVGADFPAGAVASELEKHEASYGSGDAEAFSRTAARMAGDAVSSAANRQMLADAGEDTLFARVPTSPRACPWCIALASQGFVYASEAKAGKFDSWHTNCRCRVIPSYDRQIEGYDPDEYLELYLLDKRLKAEGKTQRQRLRARDAAIVRRRCRVPEAAKPVPVDYSLVPREQFAREVLKEGMWDESNFRGPGTEWRDLFAHDALSRHGFAVKPKPADAPRGFSNIDMWMDGELWEIKSPHDDPKGKPPKEKNRYKFVRANLEAAEGQFLHQFNRATGKFEKIDYPTRVVFSGKYKDEEDDEMLAEIVTFLDRHSRYEVIFIDREGKVFDLRKMP